MDNESIKDVLKGIVIKDTEPDQDWFPDCEEDRFIWGED